jgi:hypothetical protein
MLHGMIQNAPVVKITHNTNGIGTQGRGVGNTEGHFTYLVVFDILFFHAHDALLQEKLFLNNYTFLLQQVNFPFGSKYNAIFPSLVSFKFLQMMTNS